MTKAQLTACKQRAERWSLSSTDLQAGRHPRTREESPVAIFFVPIVDREAGQSRIADRANFMAPVSDVAPFPGCASCSEHQDCGVPSPLVVVAQAQPRMP